MRTFSAGFTLAKNNKENAPVNLLEIAWPARPLFPAKTIRLADRPFTIDGTNWLALVEDWGGLDNFPDRGDGGRASPPGVSSLRINLLNVLAELGDGAERFSDFLRRYPPEAATVTLYQWFDNEGLDSSDITELFVGRVIDPIEYDEGFCSFHVELGFRSYGAAMLGNVLSASNYPNAPDESIGKVLPVVIGNVAKVPGIALRKVKRTRIASVVLPGAVSIDVGSTSGFPSSGTLVVNDDEVTYTGVTATQFTGCSGINEFHYSGDEAALEESRLRRLY